MMRWLATYIMRGRMQATFAAAGFMGLSFVFPLFSYFSAAAIGLVALRLGWQECARVLLGAFVSAVLIAWVVLGDAAVGALFGLVVWAPLVILALVLRKTSSLPVTLAAATLIGVAGVLVVYLVIDDPATWWRENLIAVIQSQVIDRSGLDSEQAEIWRSTLDKMAVVMTGIVAAAVVMSNVFSLLLARWWQAMLYNPGGFRSEYFALRLGRTMTFATLLMMIVSMLPLGAVAAVAKDVTMVLLLVYMLQGLAVIHATVAARNAGIGWLIALYIIMMIALPQTVVLLAMTGVMDTWIDVRSRVRARSR